MSMDAVPISAMSDADIHKLLRKNALALKADECKKIVHLIGRDPSLTELHMFNIQWSEHCSYKSSRETLKLLPTAGPTVIQGPEEDAGIIKFTVFNGEQYGIVMAHESHNHPSQVVPYEGAATGIGGIVRDVLCMGASVIAVADPLRFGDPYGRNANSVKYIANAVIDGIAGYGNPIGVPNLAGDVYFNESFDDNCIVNVVCLGLVREEEIIHSRAPDNAEGYDIIIVGKATDYSGFGGAAFASLVLDEDEEEYNKGAVQVPDPFLKNVIIRATEEVFRRAKKRGITLGFKDMGAGGIMCSTSELCESGGYGAAIDLDKVHVSVRDLPSFVTACSETQERFTWASPPDFTQEILRIYNEEFELPRVAQGACASVIGKVTKKRDYRLSQNGALVCNVPIEVLTKGIHYQRESKMPDRDQAEPVLSEPADYSGAILNVLAHPNVACKELAYRHYDTEVQGLAVIRPGEADAGVQAPIPGSKAGIALSVDHNPRYSRISPYWGGAAAVAEAMRNVAAVGAVPSGMTDCLNFGNPEVPESFHDFVESVKGIADAAKKISWKGDMKSPVPFVSGNVSFYNESANGKQVDPSPIIACLGVLEDFTKAATMDIKEEDSRLLLIGPRKDELGGSVYYDILGKLGKNIPITDFEHERGMIYAVIDCIGKGLLLSCHDISDGGMVAAIAEMCITGSSGASINLDFCDLRTDRILFSETSGFVLEASEGNLSGIKEICSRYNVTLYALGKTAKGKLTIKAKDRQISIGTDKLSMAWKSGFANALR
ncbi:MAG: phosphoribosylformylglycinamidine synthase subunit PurL [archaeon]